MESAKILIVEDNRIVAEDIKQTLEKQGYETAGIATSAKKAFEIIENVSVDMALMDVNLGEGGNGITVAQRLKEDFQIPVIYLTAHADKDTIERAKKTEPFGYLVKPFDELELQSALEVALYKFKADLNVKKSEQWLRTTLKSIGDGVVATDIDGNVNYLNPVAERLTGWSLEEAMNKPLETVFRIVDENTREICENPVRKVLESGKIVGLANHTILIGKNGHELPIKDSGSPIVLENGDTIGVVLVFQDDTKNKEKDQALRSSEEKYRSFVENFQGIAFRIDKDFSFDFLTGNVVQITGYPDNDFISGKVLYRDLIHPEDRERVHRQIERFMVSPDASSHRNYRIVDKNGQVHWVNENIIKIETSGGDERFDGTIQDITKRKKAESQIELLKIAVDNSAESICITDTRGIIEYVNLAFETLSGYSQDELIGKNPSILKSGKHDHYFYKTLWDTLKDNQTWYGTFINKKKDGTIYFEKASISPVLDHNQETTHYIAVKRDISEDMEKEKMLRQSQKMEAIGTLAGGIAHDFNNILSPILGFSQLSLSSVEEGTIIEDNLNEINKAALRAKDLVKQILTFARRSDEGTSPIKIHPIVKETLKFIRSSIPVNIKIESEIENVSHVMADPTQIHQIMMNLCTNAYQAMEETGGILNVTLNNVFKQQILSSNIHNIQPKNYARLTVSDTGTGIHPDRINAIFEPYYTTKKTGEGTGLGLAVCEGAIKNMNGDIFVDSTLGKGTTFTIYLPTAENSVVPSSHQPDKTQLPKGKETILFVDDEISITKMTKKILTSLGYKVKTFTSSLEAFSYFKNDINKFDLVITDMTMPDMTGDVLAKEIKAICPDIPIILCTGYSKKVSEDEIEDYGINAYCRKPVSVPTLAKKVRRLLDQAKPL